MIETLGLLNRLQFYSGCDEIRVAWDGNIISLRFEWLDPHCGCIVTFTEAQVANTKLNIETHIMDIVNHEKKKYFPPLDEINPKG